MVINRDPQLAKIQRKDCRILSPKSNIYIAILHARLRIVSEDELKAVRASDHEKKYKKMEHSCTYYLTEVKMACTNPMQHQARSNLCEKRGSVQEVLPLT